MNVRRAPTVGAPPGRVPVVLNSGCLTISEDVAWYEFDFEGVGVLTFCWDVAAYGFGRYAPGWCEREALQSGADV